jgi:hypothetical protein
MNIDEIKQLVDSGIFPNPYAKPKLVETHISWVILLDELVYKIKKQIQYSFLDFSSLEKRLFYCREEIRLNWRLTFNIYLNVVEIRKINDQIVLGGEQGEIIDYAVCMRRLDGARQMDRLLVRNLISHNDINRLARQLAMFHQKTTVIKEKALSYVGHNFRDLLNEKEFMLKKMGADFISMIESSVHIADEFLEENQSYMEDRLQHGLYRDGHGDLHTRNIFLLDQPVIFDCIEFNSDYRQIDILNEVAFLCMDLESVNRHDLSSLFLKYYANYLPISLSDQDMDLFTYYKAYRANVRAKVNCLRAQSATDDDTQMHAIKEAKKYLYLMDEYINSIATMAPVHNSGAVSSSENKSGIG